jgi:exodeoxyribonuclease VII large subunit
VTGIGHETDFTIADFVADVRAPTPSGAAEVSVPDAQDWLRRFSHYEQRALRCAERKLTELRDRSAWLRKRLGQLHPGVLLRQQLQRSDELELRLQKAMQFSLVKIGRRLTEQTSHLHRLSPAAQLSGARSRFDLLREKLSSSIRVSLERGRTKLALASRTLNTVSPLATLDRGYAIVTTEEGRVATQPDLVPVGSRIEARLARGRITARVEAHLKEES